MDEEDHIAESPILPDQAGLELQILWLEIVRGLEWAILGNDDGFTTDDLILKASFGSAKGAIVGAWDWVKNLFIPPRLQRPDPSTDPEGYKEWIFRFLNDNWNRRYRRMREMTSFIGYLSGFLSGKLKLPPDRTKNMGLLDYHLALLEKENTGLSEPERLAGKLGISIEQAYQKIWAKEHAAEWVAIYDETGERAGRAYDVCSELFRRQIEEAVSKGETVGQIRSRLAHPDILGQLEAGKITEGEYFQWTFDHLNRDMQRFALTEASFAFNNGKLAFLSDMAKDRPVYVQFVRV